MLRDASGGSDGTGAALADPVGAQEAAPRTGPLVAVLAAGGIVVSLMQTLVIPLVPRLPVLVHATPANTSWAVTVTLLAGAVATPVMGRLGDMYGKRRMLLVCLATLVAGSVIGGFSQALTPLVVGRALQGLASGVIPLGISIMRDVLPADRLTSATALMSASLGIGGAFGLPLAALLAQVTDWHVLFFVSGGLGVVVFVLVLRMVPAASPVRGGGRFDVVGALGLSVALVCLLLPVSKGGDWGWTSPATLGLFAAAVLILAAWGWWESRARRPLVDLRSLVRRQVLLTNIASVIFGFAMFAMSLILPQLLQLPRATGYGLGHTMLAAGLLLAPTGLMMSAMAPVSARITRSRGPRVTLMAGAVLAAAGYGLGVVLLSASWQLVLVACLIAAGIGLSYGAMPALIMGAVPVSETAAANGLNTLMRSIGTSVSSTVAGAVLAHLVVSFHGTEVPSLTGFRVVMAVAAGTALLAVGVAAFLPRRRPGNPSDPAPTGPRHAATRS